MNKAIKLTLCVALGATLSGCHIYKKYETPTSTPVLSEYARAAAEPADSLAMGNLEWQQMFTDPVLASLIDEALRANTNLRNAELNVEAARARVLGAKLAYLPSLALSPNGAGAKYGASSLNWSYTLPAQASWEVDIFAKLLNGKRGAQAALRQTEAYRQATRSQIIAGVANVYYNLQAVNEQIRLLENTIGLWQETVQKMRDLKEAGRTNEAAVTQAQANLLGINASLADMAQAAHELNNALALLLNRQPVTLGNFFAPSAVGSYALTLPAQTATALPGVMQNGVPVAMLAARPDVAAAEQALAVAYYSTNSARAAFYPGLTISVNGGFTDLLGGMVRNPGEWFMQLAGSLVAPLFSRGQNIAGLKGAKAQQEVAMNDFEYAILSAASEVSNAYTVYVTSQTKSEWLTQQVAELAKTVDYTEDLFRYSTGSVDYLQVLTAQQALLQAQTGLITAKNDANLAVVSLYQSVGGGR